ncbi:MAG TPA: diguanylate cyclase [Kiritimatiellia bacterium]|nr:diguanylate cyclase [Kiritimatiellia bacterium]HPS07833.1 diguanylate cyclase [Kiritimatiellia bacterium]
MKRRSSSDAPPACNRAGRELAEILTYAVTNSPATVMITDLDGTIEYVNQTFCELTDFSLADVFGKKASMLRSGLLPKALYRTLWRHLRKGQSWTGELHNRKKNGDHYWEQASISPIRDDEGNVRHFLKIGEDISQRKQLELELRSAVQKLQVRESRLQIACKTLEETTRALRKSQEKLRRLSQEDALTGLLNRRGFVAELQRVKALAERQGHGIGILIIDIDHFKAINDEYGHAAGDRILKSCASLLRAHLRASDLICRYGGDEILIVLPAADAETTRTTAQRIIAAIRQRKGSPRTKPIPITVSIGAACGVPAMGQTPEKTMKLADLALYRAKRNGRNGMAFWPSDEKKDKNDFASFGEGAHSQPFRYVFHMLVAMLDAREKATGDHSKRVAQMAGSLANAMKLPRHQIELVTQGALLHDIGKIAIPDTILLKPASLSAAERKIVQKHPKTGHDILCSSPEFNAISEIVLSHQERFDGTGYPRGLKGKRICLGARIFAVADAYDAIRAGRPYAAPRSAGEALCEIQRGRGTQFDPDVVDALTRCQHELEVVLNARQAPSPAIPSVARPRKKAPAATHSPVSRCRSHF